MIKRALIFLIQSFEELLFNLALKKKDYAHLFKTHIAILIREKFGYVLLVIVLHRLLVLNHTSF